ncbi:phage major capsid protein [Clostridium perfringens]|nr:phage major capsid protein [Clostridium perfringens]
MTKLQGMKNKLNTLKNEAQELLNSNKVKEAKEKMEEIKDLKAAIEIQEALDKEEKENLKKDADNRAIETDREKNKKNANVIRAMIKKVTGKQLTEAENSLLLPSPTGSQGTNGESYILPEDVSTLIHKKIRQYKSMREVLGYMPGSALTGSFPIEDFETLTGLVDFTDGTDGEDNTEVKFKNVKYSLKEKAAFIKLSNTLLNLTDNALIDYIVEVFSKKAVVTENKMAVEVLKSNKTPKTLKEWKDIKSLINKELDPGVLFDTVIVTNQDGFDWLDSQEDKNGRPILQPNPTETTKSQLKGYTIEQFSNGLMPTNENKIPFFIGNLKEAAKLVDLNGQVAFATSSEAGFMSNTTIARLIEFIDVIQVDKSDKCYVYAELDSTTIGKE